MEFKQNRKNSVYFALFIIIIAVITFYGCETLGEPESLDLQSNLSIDENTERQIKLDFWNYFWPEFDIDYSTIDDFKFRFYFGTYNGWIVKAHSGIFRAIGGIRVVGYDFIFPSIPNIMFVWQNGRIYDVQEAVESGILTKDNVRTMHERHKRIVPNLYRQ